MPIERVNEGVPENAEVIRTENGDIRLVFGLHNTDQPQADFGPRPGGFALEYDGVSGSAGADRMQEVSQYKTALEVAGRDKKPLFLVDAAGTRRDSTAGFMYEPGVVGILTAIGYTALNELRSKKEMTVTRRNLGRAAAGAALTYLGADVVARGLTLFGSPQSEVTEVAASMSDSMDPGSVATVKLRNIVIADHLEYIKSHYPEMSDEELVGLFGPRHKGIGHFVRMGHDARMQEMTSILKNVPMPFSYTVQELSTIARLDPSEDGREWGVSEFVVNNGLERAAREAGVEDRVRILN